MLQYLLTIIAGLLYGNFGEWMIHKHVLHSKSAKTNKSFFNHDSKFYGLEVLALTGALVLHLPVLYLSKIFYCTLVYCALNYYFKHRKAHKDLEWCKKYMPWHYDHHMGSNQDMNWCITQPWFDHIFGTRQQFKD